MEIVYEKITDLIPYENNPRNIEAAVPYVAESIKCFGFKVPVVITKDKVIIAGHTRYAAAQQLELKDVPCVIADDLSPEQIRAFRLADNKTREIAGWDTEKLEQELSMISMGMDVFGFDLHQETEKNLEAEDPPKETERVICPRCGKMFEVES